MVVCCETQLSSVTGGLPCTEGIHLFFLCMFVGLSVIPVFKNRFLKKTLCVCVELCKRSDVGLENLVWTLITRYGKGTEGWRDPREKTTTNFKCGEACCKLFFGGTKHKYCREEGGQLTNSISLFVYVCFCFAFPPIFVAIFFLSFLFFILPYVQVSHALYWYSLLLDLLLERKKKCWKMFQIRNQNTREKKRGMYPF